MTARLAICLFAAAFSGYGVRLTGDCVYDQYHKQGGQIAPCPYQAVPITTITMSGSSTPAFSVDGAHLSSVGAMKYIKQKKSMGPSDFLSCNTPECSELNVSSSR